MDVTAQQLTLAWLASTFETCEGASLARREVYREYVEFCQRLNLTSTTAAIFGKLVRMVFPAISSRRLGRRGANVVHYYNFRKKPNPSPRHATATATTPTVSTNSPTPAASPVSPSSTVPSRNWVASLSPEVSHQEASAFPPLVTASSPSPKPLVSAFILQSRELERTSPAQRPVALRSRCGVNGATVSTCITGDDHGLASPDGLSSSSSSSSSLIVPGPFAMPFPPVNVELNFDRRSSFPTYQNDQKMDDPYTLASSAQARINAPTIPSDMLSDQPSTVWSLAEGQLHAMALASHFMDHYRHSYYIQCPLHPAALEENNVLYVLCTKEGVKERSALSLNVYYALCLGAMISGYINHARELFQITKDHLSDVFDMTDYSVAQALVPMGFSERFFARDEAEGWRVSIYYLTLANQICRRLGALASDVYSRCSKAVFFMEDVDIDSHPTPAAESPADQPPLASKQDVSWEEIIRTELNFHQQIQHQKQRWSSYSRPRRTHKTLYAILFAIVDLMDAMNNLEKLRQTALIKRLQLVEAPKADEEESECTERGDNGRVLARLLGLLAPEATQRIERAKASYQRQAEGLYEQSNEDAIIPVRERAKTIEERGLGTRDVSRIAQYFTDQLLLLEEELLILYQGTEIGERYLSEQSYHMTKLFVYGLRVENRWIAGDRSAALALIMDFLEVHRRNKYNLMLFENKPTFQRILDFLHEMGRPDVMLRLLSNLEPLAKVAPVFTSMCDHYARLASE